jgi:ParB-like chromosome segregation protein Spo0J
MRLLELPEPVQELVNQGELPERFARQLVSVAKAAPKEVVRMVQVIAKAAPEDREEVFDEQLDDLLDEHGRVLAMRGGCFWDASWLPQLGAVACRSCPSRAGELYGPGML